MAGRLDGPEAAGNMHRFSLQRDEVIKSVEDGGGYAGETDAS
jgi:hypothetical protein